MSNTIAENSQFPGDIIAEIQMLKSEDGGKKQVITGDYSCPARIDGRFFDCRVHIGHDRQISPGETTKTSVTFLDWNGVKPRLSVGAVFELFEGRTVGHARVLKIIESG